MSGTGLQESDLVTQRLRLRRLRRSDAALISLYASDPRVARMTTSIPHPYPPGLAETYVARVLSPATRETVWALDLGSDSENGLIGVIGITERGDGLGEIGYWVAPAFWGTGFAGEAVEAVVAQAASSGLQAVTAQVFQDNHASFKVLTRAGFVFDGVGEAYSLARGGMVPTFRYHRDLTAG